MANVKVELDLDWLNDEFGVSLEKEVKNKIISDITNRVNLKITETLDKKVMEVVEKNVGATVGDYLTNIMADKLDDIKIPTKSSEWNAKVEFIPLSEYVGKKYTEYLSAKVFDEKGNRPQYSSDAKYTIIENYLGANMRKAIDDCMLKTLKDMREATIKHITETLKLQIQAQLNAETIAKLNIEKIISDLTKNINEVK